MDNIAAEVRYQLTNMSDTLHYSQRNLRVLRMSSLVLGMRMLRRSISPREHNVCAPGFIGSFD